MKKHIAFLLCLIMILSLFSCDIAKDIEDTNNESVSKSLQENDDNIDTGKNNAQSTQTQSEEILSKVDLEKYIGIWHDDLVPPNDLVIISKDNGELEGRLGIYRLTTFDLIITVKDEEYSFYDRNNLILGKIDFKDTSVLVTIEKSNTGHIQNGATWLFTIKGE